MESQPSEFNTAPQIFRMMQGSTELVSIDYGESASGSKPTGPLDPGEVLTGTPTIATTHKPSGSSALTTSNVAVNTASLYINGRTASAGEAIQFKVVASSTQTKGMYRMSVTCATDSTPARTMIKIIRILVVDS